MINIFYERMVIHLNQSEVLGVLRREPMFNETVNREKPSMEHRSKIAMYYIGLSTKPELNIAPSEEELEDLYQSIRWANVVRSGGNEENCAIRIARLEARWPILKRAMQENRGFYQFVKDNGKDSPFMPEFYFDLPGRMKPSETIAPEFRPNSALVFDTPYGYYKDGDGIYKQIPMGDPAIAQIQQEPFWDLVRYRGALAFLMRKWAGDGAKVLSIGGGAVPEQRFFSWQNEGIKQFFTVYDSSPDVREVLPVVFEKPLSDYGVTFYSEDSKRAVTNPDLQKNQDLVLAMGYLSYYQNELDRKFAEVRCNMRSGGHFCGDFEKRTADLGKSGLTLGWNLPGLTMDPYTDTNKQMDLVAELAEKNGFKVAELVTDEWVNGAESMLWMDLVAA